MIQTFGQNDAMQGGFNEHVGDVHDVLDIHVLRHAETADEQVRGIAQLFVLHQREHDLAELGDLS